MGTTTTKGGNMKKLKDVQVGGALDLHPAVVKCADNEKVDHMQSSETYRFWVVRD